MTRFTVTWQPEAEDELAAIWIAAADRNDISAAVRVVDLMLSTDAESKGYAVSEGLRSIVCSPLRLLFVVRQGDRIAHIVLVRRV